MAGAVATNAAAFVMMALSKYPERLAVPGCQLFARQQRALARLFPFVLQEVNLPSETTPLCIAVEPLTTPLCIAAEPLTIPQGIPF